MHAYVWKVEVLLKFEEICLETGKAFAAIFCNVSNLKLEYSVFAESVCILSYKSSSYKTQVF